IGKRTGTNVLFDPALTNGKTAPALKGEMTAPQALEKALAGSELVIDKVQEGTISIRARGGRSENPTRLAQAQSAGVSEEERAQRAEALENLVVTGTRLGRNNQSVPVKAYNAERIEESGKTTVAQFLNTLPEVSIQASQDRFMTNGGQTSVRI